MLVNDDKAELISLLAKLGLLAGCVHLPRAREDSVPAGARWVDGRRSGAHKGGCDGRGVEAAT